MATKKTTEGKKLKITLKVSIIGCLEKQKKTVQALGLKKIRSSVIQNDNDAVRGMIFAVRHLVAVEELA
jgi:large subunit ribosomal protein L30